MNDKQIPELLTFSIGRDKTNNIVIDDSNNEVSRFHAVLIKCSPHVFLVEDKESKNGTYIRQEKGNEWVRIQRKIVHKSDYIRFANSKFEKSVAEWLITPMPQPNVPRPTIEDYTNKYSQLKSLWKDYQLTKKTLTSKIHKEEKQKKKAKRFSIVLASVVGIGAATTGIGSLVILSSAGLGMLLPMLVSELLNSKEKLEALEKVFEEQYICPICKNFLGSVEWSVLEMKKKCPKCNEIWVK